MSKDIMGLKSHPHLQLYEHIEQIKSSFLMMQQYHSSKTVSRKMINLLEQVAVLHDTGKSTTFFQEYIENPASYKGNKNDKAHTGLSVFFSLLWLSRQALDNMDNLLVAAIISGHHSQLPTLPERKIGSVQNSENAIDRFFDGDSVLTLSKQIKSIDFQALSKETGIDFANICNEQNVIKSMVRSIRDIKVFLHDKLIKPLKNLEIEKAIEFRLYCQLAYSLLLEADKALLAVSNPEIYLKHSKNEWCSEWVEKRIGTPLMDRQTNILRQVVRQAVLQTIEVDNESNIFSLTAPTGVGKTLLAASWALKMREKSKDYKKIIIVLPFLSVIDQTVKEYKRLLKVGRIENDTTWLMTSHSLSERVYDYELSDKDNSFLVDTWRSDLIITTYDQFLLSLMEPKGKYQMRFHNLCDALIVVDEVQSLPCKLWKPLSEIFKQIVRVGNSKLLLMSATLPPFVDATPLLHNPEFYFMQCQRYVLRLRLENTITMEEFYWELERKLPCWLRQKQRVLLTFNTRKNARKVRDYIADWLKGEPEFIQIPLYFISADVTPKDRLNIIDQIKCGNSCIVVSTQCIEAGVDIDMDLIIRDFAPLDSLIQIAGRCNREGKNSRGTVEIIDIMEEEKRYSDLIYDEIHLDVTRNLLCGNSEILEEDIFSFSERYFTTLSLKKDTGKIHLERFGKWEDDVSIKELLRGKEKRQYTFLVLSEDLELKHDIDVVCDIEDQWDRREGWRKLAGRIAMISISIFAQPRFHPESIADAYKGQWILREGYYSSDKGLVVEGETMII